MQSDIELHENWCLSKGQALVYAVSVHNLAGA